MKTISDKLYAGLFALVFLFTTGNVFAQDNLDQIVDKDKREVIKSDAEDAKEAFISRNPEIENELNNAAGYAIFPNVGKGAYILGGAAGNGVVYRNGEVEGFAELRQIDVGLQIGGKAFRELIIFRTEEAFNRFTSGDFQFEGTASAVIWDEGAAKSIQFENGIGVALMPKGGAMAGISVGGQEFNYGSIE